MKKALKSVIYMFVITLVFSSMVSAVKVVNDERIERNQKIKLQKIILNVLKINVPPKASDEEIVKIFDSKTKRIDVDGRPVYVGYEDGGEKVKGYAFPVGGPGFWGPIYGMAAVDSNADKLLGVAFYKHSETPGLGGRISEGWFQKQFEGLSLHRMEGDKQFFYLKMPGATEKPNELDAVTGATNTSSAVEKFLNDNLNEFMRKLWTKVQKG